MLLEIHIENLAVIESLSLQFGEGLCAITGETGAGKSLIIGALQLILGERGGADRIRANEKEMNISARFAPEKFTRNILKKMDINDDEIIITRRITQNGRGYFWINGKPATAETVRNIGKFLVDLHGQHAHQLLLDQSTHREILDEFGKLNSHAARLGQLFTEYNALLKQLAELRSQREGIMHRQRLVTFELEELSAAGLENPDEEEKLEKELGKLEAAEELINFSNKINEVLLEGDGNVTEIIGALREDAKRFEAIDEIEQALENIDTILAAAEELAIIAAKLENVEYDPVRTDEIRQRLQLLGNLSRKYKKTIIELIEYFDYLKKRNVEDANFDEREAKIENELESLRGELTSISSELSRGRQNASKELASAAEAQLRPLAMDNAKFVVRLDMVEDEDSPFQIDGRRLRLFKTGFERCSFMFSANPGNPPRELSKIVSGGELSRIALALKIILPDSDKVGCAVFDELDSGIGGKTAVRIAKHLKKLAEKRQVIVVTHLHSIARRADHHIYIEKKIEKNQTSVEAMVLNPEQRKDEIERMMALE